MMVSNLDSLPKTFSTFFFAVFRFAMRSVLHFGWNLGSDPF